MWLFAICRICFIAGPAAMRYALEGGEYRLAGTAFDMQKQPTDYA